MSEMNKRNNIEKSTDQMVQDVEEWVKVASVDDFPVEGGACALVKDKQIAIYNFTSRGEWYATQNLCPHKKEMALSRGLIGDANGTPKVACPFHKKTFSLLDGKNLNGEDEYEIKTYPVKIENGQVYVRIL